MDRNMKNGTMDFSNELVKKQIAWRAFQSFEQKLGKKNEGNQSIYEGQLLQAKELISQYQEALLPNGSYVLHREKTVSYIQLPDINVQAELLFTLQSNEVKQESVSDGFLYYLLQVSYLDSVREYIKETLFPTLIRYYLKEEAQVISPLLGAGLFDSPLKEIDRSRKQGHMVYGVLYSTDEAIPFKHPCQYCKAQTGCEYCMIHNKKYGTMPNDTK